MMQLDRGPHVSRPWKKAKLLLTSCPLVEWRSWSGSGTYGSCMSIPLDQVRSELNLLGYGKEKTARTLLVHVSTMIFKSDQNYSDFTEGRGNGIVAGCQRSKTIARAVTLLGFGKTRAFSRTALGCKNILLPRYQVKMPWTKLGL